MRLTYRNVCLEAFSHTLPERTVTSQEIESRLRPLYRRLRLPEGRLEMMTGIVQRRVWPVDTLPSRKSVETAEKAIQAAGIDRKLIGALVHGSVCRDYLEPATACGVHRALRLPEHCLIYDISNACLGLLNGMVEVANMIELGQIRAGLVVGTESSGSLLETTIRRLNEDTTLSRHDIKPAIASLTIGSGSAAILLAHRNLSRTGNRLLGGVARTDTQFCQLCHSGRDESVVGNMRPLMDTDSEALMREGIRVATDAFHEFLGAIGWDRGQIDKTFCHQVGVFHRKTMFGAIGLDPVIDYPTVAFLGNTGSVALPMTAALGIENGHLRRNDHVALMGIGSGINVLMLGVDWQQSLLPQHPIVSGPQTKAAELPAHRC